jgi:hypothetical protein
VSIPSRGAGISTPRFAKRPLLLRIAAAALTRSPYHVELLLAAVFSPGHLRIVLVPDSRDSPGTLLATDASGFVAADSAGGVPALMPSSGMLPPMTILTAGGLVRARADLAIDFASSSNTCSAPFLVRMTSLSVCSNAAWLVRIAR